MNVDTQSFKGGAVRPVECLREGWRLVKDDYWLFLGITLVGLIFGSMAPFGILMGPAFCGIHFCLLRKERGRHVSFDMLFRGFDYFAQSLIATLIMVLPLLVLAVACYLLFMVGIIGTIAAMPKPAPGQPPDTSVIWIFVALVTLYALAITGISIVFNLLFFFTYPLIVDRGLSGFEAVKLSIRAAFGNFLGVFGVIVLTQILSILGVLLCYFGVIFVLPITFAMVSVAYQQVFHDEEALADVAEELDEPRPALPVAETAETGIQGSHDAAAGPANEPGGSGSA
jgi:uncharacterized membrane protein